MKKHLLKVAMGILISGALITSCKKETVEEPNEEVIRLPPVRSAVN
jgi:hypothetical protein